MNIRRNLIHSKDRLKYGLRNRGYDVVKVPGVDYQKIDFLGLIADRLNKSGEPIQVVQIGANDGVEDDGLRRHFLKNEHWSAIFVEPQTYLIDSLTKSYSEVSDRVVVENLAIAPGGGELKMFYIDHPEDDTLSVFTSTIRENVSKNNPYEDHFIKELNIPCETVSGLLDKHDIEELDLLVVDTEGFDWEVLKTINFARHKPKAIQFESGHLTVAERKEAFSTLSEHGYALQWNGCDSFALLEESE